MTNQEGALAEITSFLEHQNVPYMVIGGIANLIWGEPRATLDVDVTVLVPAAGIERFIEFGLLPFEEDAVRRAARVEAGRDWKTGATKSQRER